MRYTADREGHKWQESTGQDKLLEKLYGSAVGRCILRPLVSPVVSKLGGRLLDSGISTLAIAPFIRKTGTSLSCALTAGAIALLVNWGMERSSLFYSPLTNRSVKNYLIRGARRRSSFSYPNQEWGYGELDLYGVLASLL